MSGWMSSWFGGTSNAKTAAASKQAIVSLRTQLEMLRKREAHTEKQIAEQDALARKHVAGNNKTAAKTALKRKKQLEQNLVTTQAHIDTLEQQMYTVENANINIETVRAMKEASDTLRVMHKKMGVDKVDATMDEIRETMQDAEDVSVAITSANIGAQDPLQDEELERELEELEQEKLDEQMLGAPAAPVTATPGMVKPVAQKAQVIDEEEEELRKLQAEMAM